VVVAGQLTLVPITITNQSQSPRAIEISFRPLAPIDQVIDESARARYDATSWLSVDNTDLLLATGESQIVPIRVKPPSDAGPGGHYANVVFRVLNDPLAGSDVNNAAINPELTSILFLTVPGDISEIAEADFSHPSLIAQSSPRNFGVELANIGTVHLLPTIYVSLVQLSGHEIERLTTPPKLSLPGTRVNLSADWADPPPGIYRAKYSVSYGSPLKRIDYVSGVFIVLPALWIQLVLIGTLLVGLRFIVPAIFRRLPTRRLQLAKDLTGEPNIRISREKIENTDQLSNLKDVSKKK
jgi:hypothetical protein